MCLNLTIPYIVCVIDAFGMSFVQVGGKFVFGEPPDLKRFMRIERFIVLTCKRFTQECELIDVMKHASIPSPGIIHADQCFWDTSNAGLFQRFADDRLSRSFPH